MRSISIIGGKGGVGKTTVASNLSAVLSQLGYSVVAIDANLTTPNLGLHLGVHLSPRTIHDVLKEIENVEKALYPHPLGFKVLPGSLSVYDLNEVDPSKLSEIVSSLSSDYAILDSAAGLGREALAALDASEEVLIVTNPELPAVADALRTVKIAERLGKNIIGVVLNRVKGKKNELSKLDVESMLSYPVIAQIPEDSNVVKAVNSRTPVVVYKPTSPAAIELRNLGFAIAGLDYRIKRSWWQRLFSWR